MTVKAWTFMGLAWSIIVGCTLFCFVKLLSSDNLHESGENADSDTAK